MHINIKKKVHIKTIHKYNILRFWIDVVLIVYMSLFII